MSAQHATQEHIGIEHLTQPLLFELDKQSWDEQLDRASQWFDNVIMVQALYEEMVSDLKDKVHEPHVREYLENMHKAAREHMKKARGLYKMIGRESGTTLREISGDFTAKLVELYGGLLGRAGGAAGAWPELNLLLLESLHAIAAFGAAEQLGYALGMPDVAGTCFEVANEKFAHFRQLQEVVLDFAAYATLYRMEV